MFWYRLSSHYKRDFHWLLYLEEFCFSVISSNWLKLPKVTWCMTSKNYFRYLLKLFSNLYLGKKKRMDSDIWEILWSPSVLNLLHGNCRQLQVTLTASCKLQNVTKQVPFILFCSSTESKEWKNDFVIH